MLREPRDIIERFAPRPAPKPVEPTTGQNPERWEETAPFRVVIKDKIADLMREANALKAAATQQKPPSDLHLIDTALLRHIVKRVEEYSSSTKDSRLPPLDVMDHLTFAELVSRVEETDLDAAEFLEKAVLGGGHVTSLNRRRYRDTQRAQNGGRH